ncbi:MAG: PEP-CTERM sorting domain-containing protein [Terracidiphilus sp.]|jgi:hypothetical protein
MKKYVLALLAMATALAITPCVSATSITGSIGITGSADTWSSTEITFDTKAGNATVAGSPSTSGTLSAVIGDDVSFPNNPLTFSTADGENLFSTGDGVYMEISTLIIDGEGKKFLNLEGTGWIWENGYDVTPVDWTLTSTDAGGAVHTTLGIDAVVSTPEPSSLLLLGTGLLGLALITFKTGLFSHS